MPPERRRAMTSVRNERWAAMSKPWSEVAWRTSSGTVLTRSGLTLSTSSMKRASGLPSMLNSAPGNWRTRLASTGTSARRMWRSSGRGWTVMPWAPASRAMRASSSREGQGRLRRLRKSAMALTFTERAAAMSHPQALDAARDGGNAGAHHFDKAERLHQRDELLDLAGLAGQLEDEGCVGRIDDAGAEGVGEPQRLDAVIAGSGHLDQRELALDGIARHRQIGHRMDRDEALELALDLLQHHRRAAGDDGDARDVRLVLGLRHGEGFDVVAAAGEQADDAGEDSRLVVDDDREGVSLDRILAILEKIGGCRRVDCGLVHDGPPTPGPCLRRRLPARFRPPGRPRRAASHGAPCRRGSSGSSWRDWRPGNRTAPAP